MKPNNGMLEQEDIETIENVMNHFEPLTEQEQKLMLFMCIHSAFELAHMEQTQAVKRQIATYQMLVDLLTKSDLREGELVKEFIFKQVEVDYEDLLGGRKDA